MSSASSAAAASPRDGVLAPYRVLDLSDERGFLCGRILGDLGADVVKVEPPGGDPGRRVGPFAGAVPHPERSLYWWAYNCNKRGITLALDTPTGRALFARLVRGADIVVESFDPGTMDRWQFGPDQMRAANPRLIVVSITPYGQSGPRAAELASDLEIMASSGFLALTGEPAREPVRITLAQSPMWSGLHAAMGALMALHARALSGTGQHVDVSAQASMIAGLGHAPPFWELQGEIPRRSAGYVSGRSVTGAKMRAIWPCRDGYVTFALYGGPAGRRTMAALTAWMAERGYDGGVLATRDWATFDVATLTQEEVDALEEPISGFFQQLTKQEYYSGVLQRAMLGYPVTTAADIVADPQLTQRDGWTAIEADGDVLAQAILVPARFARFSHGEAGIYRRAPRIGEHNPEILGGELGLDAAALRQLAESGII